MTIIVGLILLAIFAAVGLTAGILGALTLGGALAGFDKTRPLARIFLSIVPMTLLGALAGGCGLTYMCLQLNESAVLLGAVMGILLGGCQWIRTGTLCCGPVVAASCRSTSKHRPLSLSVFVNSDDAGVS